jgi:hypothetical protein
MRILYIPSIYLTKNISGVSVANAMWDTFHGMKQCSDEPLYVDYALPTKDIIVPEYFLKPPWLNWTPVRQPQDFGNGGQAHAPVHLMDDVDPFNSGRAYDCIMSSHYLFSGAMRARWYRQRGMWSERIHPPIITILCETGLDSYMPFLKDPDYEMLQIGSMSRGRTWVMNEADVDYLRGVFRRWLSNAKAADLLGRVDMIRAAVNFQWVDQHFDRFEGERAGRAKTGQINVFHGGGIVSAFRKLRIMIESVDKLHAVGENVWSVIKTQCTGKNPWEKHSSVLYHPGLGREAYNESLGDGDIAFVGTNYEGTGIAYMEAIRSGMLPLIIENTQAEVEWIKWRLPAGYPFICREEGAAGTLLFMVKNFQALKAKWQTPLREALQPWNYTAMARDAWTSCHKALDEVLAPIPSSFWAAIGIPQMRKYLQEVKPAEFTAESIKYAAKRYLTRKTAHLNFMPAQTIRYVAHREGYRDICDGPEPRYVRIES